MMLNLDEYLHNADWTKQTDDTDWREKMTREPRRIVSRREREQKSDEEVTATVSKAYSSVFLRSGSDCGANVEGGGGFQPGNTCGKEEGGGGDKQDREFVDKWKEKTRRGVDGHEMAQHEKDRRATGRTKDYPVWNGSVGGYGQTPLFQFEIDALEEKKAEKEREKQKQNASRDEANVGASKEWHKELTTEEGTAIGGFFGREYEWMRAYQKGAPLKDAEDDHDEVLTEQQQETIVSHFEKGLDKAPKYNGVVYRALLHDEMSVDKVLARYNEGDVAEMKADSSSTTNKSKADHYLVTARQGVLGEPDFGDGNGFGVMLVVKTTSAADVRSANPHESEVILRKGSRYKVTKKVGRVVHMEEI